MNDEHDPPPEWTRHGETNWRIKRGKVEHSISTSYRESFVFRSWVGREMVSSGEAPTLDEAKAQAWEGVRAFARAILADCDGAP